MMNTNTVSQFTKRVSSGAALVPRPDLATRIMHIADTLTQMITAGAPIRDLKMLPLALMEIANDVRVSVADRVVVGETTSTSTAAAKLIAAIEVARSVGDVEQVFFSTVGSRAVLRADDRLRVIDAYLCRLIVVGDDAR